MICLKTSASTLLLFLSPIGAVAKEAKQLKLRDAATKNSGSTRSIFNSFLEYLKLQEPIFVPAITLDEFANVDPEAFEWVDKSEIEAGGTTCGFLKAHLGSLPGLEYPKVNVYVCVKFAKNQPAPRGNLAVHCGGPGSLSNCLYSMGVDDIGQDNADNYNVIAFDQRGMGRSSPNFVVPECVPATHDPDGIMGAVDLTQPSTIRAIAQVYKKRSLECWNHPKFKILFKDSNGIVKNYHFLEYSGTRQLAEDIERVRLLFGNQKLSVYGVSYGTKVFGTYTTMFPDNVNLMVLDGNMDPGVDIGLFVHDLIRARNDRIEYFISVCERNPKLCPVDSMRKCIKSVYDLLQANTDLLKRIECTDDRRSCVTTLPKAMVRVIEQLYQDFDMTPNVCEAAEAGDIARLLELISGSGRSTFKEIRVWDHGSGDRTVNTQSKPTDEEAGDDWPFEGYAAWQEDATFLNVVAQDFMHGAYDEETFVNFLFDLNKKYPGAGTQTPVRSQINKYAGCYHAPRVTPTPPIGNPNKEGIVSGQLYDPLTPYISTQRMRENFPLASLLTSRSVNHGLVKARERAINDPPCQNHIVNYLKTGIVAFTDGTVCESDPIQDSCTITDAVTGNHCESME